MFFTKNKSGLLEKILDNFAYRNEAELSDHLNENEQWIRQVFTNCSDLVVRKITAAAGMPAMIVYLSVLVDVNTLENVLIRNLMNEAPATDEAPPLTIGRLAQEVIPMARVQVLDNAQEVAQHITLGEAVVFFESGKQAVSVSIQEKLSRSLSEPNIEPVIIGPQVGLIENLDVNLGLIRKRLRTPQLKIEVITAGKLTQTRIAIAYIEGRASGTVLQELRARLSQKIMDSILDGGYIDELMPGQSKTLFPLTRFTQRPDSVVGSLIEGKVATFVDGSPIASILPITFLTGFQTAEDYYMHFIFATQLRWLRLVFAFLALTLPSFYVAVTTFHQEMIPTGLALTLAASREVIPFPTMLETLMMEIVFDALREAGIRLPRPVGQTISIVGALVIGQAAVQAGIISAPIVMIVSLTGIASFLIPLPKMSQAVTFLRFPMVIAAGMFGLYGIGMALIILIIHLANLRSFGVPYLAPIAPFNFTGLLDTFIRAPWKIMYKRQSNIYQKMGSE
jgi:spore germination protein KA